MAVTFLSSAVAATNTVAMPTHAAGDLIVAFALNTSSTVPTVPAGWTSPGAFASLGTFPSIVSMGYKIAANSSETTGTWTNANAICVTVYRKSASQTWTTPVILYNTANTTTLDYSILAGFGCGVASMPAAYNTEVTYLRFAGLHTGGDGSWLGTTPSGWTARDGNTLVRAIDSGGSVAGDVNSVGGSTQTVTSGGWYTANVRIEAWNGTDIVCMGAEGGFSGNPLIMPYHQAGDVIVGYASGDTSAAPTLPTGYTSLSNHSSGSSDVSDRLAYKVAVSNSESPPAFTNATSTAVAVYRNPLGTWNTIDAPVVTTGNSATLSFTGSAVTPVSGQTTRFIRCDTENTATLVDLPGWLFRSYSVFAPVLSLREYNNIATINADSVGSNSFTISSARWYANTIRLAADLRIPAPAPLTGHGTLTVTAKAKFARSVAPLGHGVFTSLARLYRIASPVALSSHGALSATATPKFTRSVIRTGTGNLTVLARMYQITSPVAFSGQASLSVTAAMYQITSPVMVSSSGVLTASVFTRYLRPTPFGGDGELSADTAASRFVFTAPLAGDGALMPTVYPRFLRGVVANIYSGSLTAAARMYQIRVVSTMTSSGTLSAMAYGALGIALLVPGHGSLSATATMYRIARTVVVYGAGHLSMVIISRRLCAVGFSGRGVLSVTTTPKFFSGVNTSGIGMLSASARLYQIAAPAAVGGRGALTSAAGQNHHGVFPGTGTLSLVIVAVRVLPMTAFYDGFDFEDDTKWDYREAAVVNGQLQLIGTL